mmetsp:Transcript_6220/g.15272  ORF Transcript_6220/g.15272 Transcript_6220/m.15272 type:complete len:299 (-) Transcript_6220:8-904(-)
MPLPARHAMARAYISAAASSRHFRARKNLSIVTGSFGPGAPCTFGCAFNSPVSRNSSGEQGSSGAQASGAAEASSVCSGNLLSGGRLVGGSAKRRPQNFGCSDAPSTSSHGVALLVAAAALAQATVQLPSSSSLSLQQQACHHRGWFSPGAVLPRTCCNDFSFANAHASRRTSSLGSVGTDGAPILPAQFLRRSHCTAFRAAVLSTAAKACPAPQCDTSSSSKASSRMPTAAASAATASTPRRPNGSAVPTFGIQLPCTSTRLREASPAHAREISGGVRGVSVSKHRRVEGGATSRAN